MYGGTNTIADLTGSRLAGPQNVSVVEAGERALAEQFADATRIHNGWLRQIISRICVWTTEKTLLYGGNDYTEMVEVDELGTARPSKVTGGYMLGFPLRPYEAAWQGSFKWFKKISAIGLRAQTQAMYDADYRNVIREILRALFRPTAYQWTDVLTDGGVMGAYKANVRPLLNADSQDIPRGPNGELFDASTHTHYVATTTFTDAGMIAFINNVAEHYSDSVIEVWAAGNMETGIRALTGFVPLDYPVIVQSDNRDRIAERLDVGNLGDRLIGYYAGRRVYIRPYVPAGYLIAINVNSPTKTIVMRYDPLYESGNLALEAEDEDYPLRAATYSRTFGPGVWDRASAAIWKPSNTDNVYVAPTTYIY